MKYFLAMVLLLCSFNVVSEGREGLLAAWEKLQKTNPEVDSFEKISDKRYKIKFVNMAYDGEVRILAYGIEKMNFVSKDRNEYTKFSYFDVDLVDASEGLKNKYRRTYYKWTEASALYFNDRTKTWDTAKMFADYHTERNKKGPIKDFLSDFKDPLLVFFLLYLVFVHLKHNKRMKDSMARQCEVVAQQNIVIEQHKQTNSLLLAVLNELKQNKT